MPGTEKWDWSKSNGNATAAATATAYAALTGGGPTADFSSAVWNDILDKISAQRISWTDTEWNSKLLDLISAKMSPGDRMTAKRFNAAVQNMPPVKNWPWQSTLGRTDIRTGDRCYGMYFVYLTDGLNYWIDLVPIPVKISNTVNFAHDVLGHALPAIHIIVKEPPVSGVFLHDIKPFLATSVPVKYTLYVNHTGELTLATPAAVHVKIINFAHVDFTNKVTCYPTKPMIAKLNSKLQHSASVSFGNIVFMSVRLPFTYTTNGRIYTDTAIPMYSQIELGQYDVDMLITLALHCRLSFSLVAKLQGEPRIIERDSVPIKAVLQAQDTASLLVTCQDIKNIKAALYAVSAVNLKITTKQALRLIVDTHSTLTMYSNVSVAELSRVAIDLPLGSLGITPKITDLQGQSLKAHFGSTFTGTANADFLSMVLAKADLQSLSDLAMTISTKEVARVIASLTTVSAITANVGTLSIDYAIARLTGQLNANVNAAIRNIQHTGVNVDALLNIGAKAQRLSGAAAGAYITDVLRITADVGTLGMHYVMSDILMLAEMSVGMFEKRVLHAISRPESFLQITTALAVKDMQHTGTNLAGLHNLTAKSVLTVPGYTGVNLLSVSALTATAVSTLSPATLSASLLSETLLTARMTAPEIIGFMAALEGAHSGVATVGLASMHPFNPTIAALHSADADVTLSTVYGIIANITGQHTGLANIYLSEASAINGRLQIIQTATATLSLMMLTLVSELEDVLVSDLDDMLVTNVEFH